MAHVIRGFGGDYLDQARRGGMPPIQLARHEHVPRDLMGCRTSVMGEHEWCCEACQQTYVYFNSRGNRHSPKCREAHRREWAEKVERDLLPVDYHHLVLTLPPPLTRLMMAHGDVRYSKLMQAGGRSILAVGDRPLGAQLGVLHTARLTARPESAQPILDQATPGNSGRRPARWGLWTSMPSAAGDNPSRRRHTRQPAWIDGASRDRAASTRLEDGEAGTELYRPSAHPSMPIGGWKPAMDTQRPIGTAGLRLNAIRAENPEKTARRQASCYLCATFCGKVSFTHAGEPHR